MRPLLFLPVLLALLAACEPPWTLLETGSTAHELVAVTRQGDTLWLGTSKGRVLKLQDGAKAAEGFSTLNNGAEQTNRIKGLLPGTQNDVYGWTEDTLLHGTGGSFTAMPPPDGVTPALRGWAPASVVRRNDTLYIATRVGDVSRLVEFTPPSFTAAPFADMLNNQVTWLAVTPNGTLWGGDSGNAHDTLYKRGATAWAREPFPLGLKGALKVAATDDTFFVITEDGIHALAMGGAHKEDTARLLPGRYTDVCVARDGRVLAVGKPNVPWFSLWSLVDGRWANINTGTREALWALYCAPDGAVYAVGGHGVAVKEP